MTGSSYLIELDGARLLVDCGMFQGEGICGKLSYAPLGFDPSTVDAVCVTHAHYDHCGRIPLLVKEGFSGPVYATEPTKALSKIVLDDAFRVMQRQAEKCERETLYRQTDVDAFAKQSVGMNYHTQFEPVRGVKAMFHDAGHILGSAFLTLDIDGSQTKSGEDMRLLFSGDIGNNDIPILPDTDAIAHADIVFCESTYGDRDHTPTKQRSEDLTSMVTKVINRGGTLIIPAFSIERTQELLFELDALADEGVMPRVPIYLDSPLAIRATQIYRHYKHYLRFDRPIMSSPDADFFSFKGLRETLSADSSKTINNDHGPKIIVAGSGMMTGGRVLHHLKRYLSDKKSGVLIIGYQAVGTLGREIEEGATSVKINKKTIEVHAEIRSIDSFSAHGDRYKLRDWLVPKKGKLKKIFLVHGDAKVKPKFKAFLKEKIDCDIAIPKFEQVIEL